MTEKRRHLFPVFALVIISAAMLLAGYWWFFPEQVVTVSNPTEIKTDKRVYQQGERIIYTLDYCKTRQIQGKVTRSLVDGFVIPYGSIESDLPVGCRKFFVYDLHIPEYTPPGIYHIEGSGEYHVNPIQTNRNCWRTEDFEVVRAPDNAKKEIEELRYELDHMKTLIKKHNTEDREWMRKHE